MLRSTQHCKECQRNSLVQHTLVSSEGLCASMITAFISVPARDWHIPWAVVLIQPSQFWSYSFTGQNFDGCWIKSFTTNFPESFSKASISLIPQVSQLGFFSGTFIRKVTFICYWNICDFMEFKEGGRELLWLVFLDFFLRCKRRYISKICFAFLVY